MATYLLEGKIAATPSLSGTLLKVKPLGGAVAASPVLSGFLYKDKLLRGSVEAAISLTGTLERLPGSQHVLFLFELDRTSIPYEAEGG